MDLRASRSAAQRPPGPGPAPESASAVVPEARLVTPLMELISMVARRLKPAAFFFRVLILFGLGWGTLGSSKCDRAAWRLVMTAERRRSSFSSESNSCGDGVRVT